VNCTAIDASENQALCSFTIHVKGAAEQIQDLLVMVSSFNLASGIENSFTSPLKSALGALVTGKKSVAVLDLQSFINHVNAQSGKKLTATQAWSLVAAATQIKTVLAIAPAAAAKTIR
jgi:hypothetical protein